MGLRVLPRETLPYGQESGKPGVKTTLEFIDDCPTNLAMVSSNPFPPDSFIRVDEKCLLSSVIWRLARPLKDSQKLVLKSLQLVMLLMTCSKMNYATGNYCSESQGSYTMKQLSEDFFVFGCIEPFFIFDHFCFCC